MIIVSPRDKHQMIIQNRVFPEIENIFPDEAECELNPKNEKESVNVKYMFLLPDNPNKPLENKYKRIIIRFSKDLIEDFLDPENKSAEKHFQTVLKRIYDRIQSEYLAIQSEATLNDKEFYEIIISGKTLNLVS